MDWQDTPEQAVFRADVRAFLRDRLPDYYRARTLREMGENWQSDLKSGNPAARTAAVEWAQALEERRWVAPHWPPEFGGAGLSHWESFILAVEFEHAGAPLVGGQGVSPLGPTIIVHGTEEQKRKYLPGILSETRGWCQGYSEPSAGSDLASLQTRAQRDGDDYVINGQKIWTSNAHTADSMFVLVRTDTSAAKHRGISLLIIDDMTTPGLSVRPLPNMAWGHEFNESFFENVRTPVANVIGAENRGWYVAMTLMDFDRMHGTAFPDHALVERIVDFARSSGKDGPSRLAELPALRTELADRYIEAEIGQLFATRIISIQARGEVPNYETSMAKAFTNTAHQRLHRTGTSVFGLYSNLWSRDGRAPLQGALTRGYVESVSATIAAGTAEIQRNVVATRGLGLPRG